MTSLHDVQSQNKKAINCYKSEIVSGMAWVGPDFEFSLFQNLGNAIWPVSWALQWVFKLTVQHLCGINAFGSAIPTQLTLRLRDSRQSQVTAVSVPRCSSARDLTAFLSPKSHKHLPALPGPCQACTVFVRGKKTPRYLVVCNGLREKGQCPRLK